MHTFNSFKNEYCILKYTGVPDIIFHKLKLTVAEKEQTELFSLVDGDTF